MLPDNVGIFDYPRKKVKQEWKQKLEEKANELVTIYTKPVYAFWNTIELLCQATVSCNWCLERR